MAGTTARVSGSMSGCRKRLKSTSPSAPASSSRRAISPVELKCGPSFTATGTVDRVLDAGEDIDVALLDVPARDARAAGQVGDVQLDRGGAGILHRPRVVGPAAGRDAVEAADDGDRHGRRRSLEQAQVPARAGLLLGDVGEVGQRLGEALGAGVGEARVLRRLAAQLLLEQRVEHHRADAGVGEPPDAVDGLRQRRRRRDQRVAQLEAHVGRRQVHHRSDRASAGKCCAPRVAISSYTSQRSATACSARPSSRSASAGSAVRQGAIAQLAVDVVGERDARPRRVEQERVLARRARHRVVAEERPVPARDGPVLLVEPVAHLDAVRDAVAVGDDERRPVVRLRLAERLERLLSDRRPWRRARRRRCRRRWPAARGPSSGTVLPAAANFATAPSGVDFDICPPVFE